MTTLDLLINVEIKHPSLRGCEDWKEIKTRFHRFDPFDKASALESITQQICLYHGINPEKLINSGKIQKFTSIKHSIWFLLDFYFPKTVSQEKIAKRFNLLSHSTVCISIKAIKNRLAVDKSFRKTLKKYEETLYKEGIIEEPLIFN